MSMSEWGVRYLTIVRHAKAEKPAPGQDDFDRRLNDCGRRQCEQLRAWAEDPKELGAFGPATVLVSRPLALAKHLRVSFEDTAYVVERFFSDLIYNGHHDVTAEDVLIDLAAIDPVTTSLCVVGHNPTVLELLWLLAKETAVVTA